MKASVEIRPSKDLSFDPAQNKSRAWFGKVSNIESCQGTTDPAYRYYFEWFPTKQEAWQWAVKTCQDMGWIFS